jgi:putative phage-type endonuclease
MNANVMVSTTDMKYQEWLEYRRKGIGGSDVAAVCGLSKWKSPVEVWLDKTGQIEPEPAGEAAYWGTLMEPVIREEFTDRTGLRVRQVNALLQHKRFPFMLANIDGIVNDPSRGEGIFEAKTSSAYRAAEWEEGLPDEYALQIQHYMAVTGFNYAYIAVLIGGNRFLWKLVEKDDAVVDLLIQMESKFWQLVETRTAPDIDGSSASTELLNRLYPESKSRVIDLPMDSFEWLQQFEQAQAEEKEAALRKEEAANHLEELLGESEQGRVKDKLGKDLRLFFPYNNSLALFNLTLSIYR